MENHRQELRKFTSCGRIASILSAPGLNCFIVISLMRFVVALKRADCYMALITSLMTSLVEGAGRDNVGRDPTS